MAGMDYEQLTFDSNGQRVSEIHFKDESRITPHKNYLSINKNISSLVFYNGDARFNDISVEMTRYGSASGRAVWYACQYTEAGERECAAGICAYGHLNLTKYYVEICGEEYDGNWTHGSAHYKDVSYPFIWNCNTNKEIPLKEDDKIESWIGITRYDIAKLLLFVRGNNKKLAKAIQSSLPSGLPETNIVSHLDGHPSLFSLMFGAQGKEWPKDFDLKRYL